MLSFPDTITDCVYTQPSRYGIIDTYLLTLVRNKRDLPFAHNILRISATMLPLAGLLFALPAYSIAWWGCAIAFFALNNFVFKGSFGLMLHCTSHRPLFIQRVGWLNHYIPWVLGPLFGQTPQSYFSHHIGMHHPENNLPADESSTMRYQRDSVKSFISYFVNFFFLGVARTAGYLGAHNRGKLRSRMLRGEAIFYMVCLYLLFVAPAATVVVFVLPYLIARLIMMVGNWTQHAFVSADEPENEYQNSITCINTGYNRTCWNDGYHTAHHLHPTLHYTEYPAHLQSSLAIYADNKAIVFAGTHYLAIFFWLMTKRYDRMVAHYVNLSGMASEEEVIAFLKSRTQRIVVE